MNQERTVETTILSVLLKVGHHGDEGAAGTLTLSTNY